jgi:hypothetical protein
MLDARHAALATSSVQLDGLLSLRATNVAEVSFSGIQNSLTFRSLEKPP